MAAAAGVKVSTSTAEKEATVEVNPEQISADNQDAIDAAFRTIMDGLDL